jgi:hypothetical protein
MVTDRAAVGGAPQVPGVSSRVPVHSNAADFGVRVHERR